jgi:uncharacterized protein (TIGR02001 family)
MVGCDFMRIEFLSATALAFTLVCGPVSAQNRPEIAWNVGIASDYVFRGYSQTDGRAQVFGGVDAKLGNFYAGSWVSNVDFGDGTDVEVDLYGGHSSEIEGFKVDFGFAGYLYPSQPDGAGYNYVELKADISRAIGPVSLGSSLSWSPDYFGEDSSATYVEANAAFVPADGWEISGAVGYQALDVSGDYVAWNLGVVYGLTETALLDVRYSDTDRDDPLADGRVVASLKFGF